MSRYDTTFIVNPQIGDEQVNASVNAVTAIITSNNGEVLRERRIGSRRLAYPIARQTHGYYVTLIHDGSPDVLPKLERHFKLGESFLRHLTIRYDGDPFRKSITDVMMGADSEERHHGANHGAANDRRPQSRDAATRPAEAPEPATSSATPAAPATEVATEVSATAVEDAPAPKPAESVEPTEAPTAPVTPEASSSDEEETL